VTEEVKEVPFAHLGRPTVDVVQRVWNEHPDPSVRTVAELLTNRGFKISFRTVARWKKNDWASDSNGGGRKSISEDQHVPGVVRQQIRSELEKVDPATVAEANQIGNAGGLQSAIEGGGLTDQDYARIEKSIKELATKDLNELKALQEKERTIMNIVLIREATRKGHVMVLIPKDTSSLIGALSDDARISMPPAPIEPPAPERNGYDAKLIEGRTIEASPLSQAIRAVREKALA
jgi:hypothetical protein